MRLRQAYAMFQVAEMLAAAGVGDGFEGFPQDFDDPTLLGNGEPDDFLCIWTDITDPDNPRRDARHYEVNLRAVPDSFEVHADLTYGMGPVDEEYAVLLADVFCTYVPVD